MGRQLGTRVTVSILESAIELVTEAPYHEPLLPCCKLPCYIYDLWKRGLCSYTGTVQECTSVYHMTITA